jgi:SAM-dependent methyltransferase
LDTVSAEYSAYLQGVRSYAQIPYRWNLKRLRLGRTLDIGCGIGRNLIALDGVGVDHNPTSVAIARSHGLEAFTPGEFRAKPGAFDSLLFAHVLEHMKTSDARALVQQHLVYLKAGGKVVFLTPQERGYASDATHVEFMDFAALRSLAASLGLRIEQSYSFPFFRWAGRFFKFNEFVVVATSPTQL